MPVGLGGSRTTIRLLPRKLPGLVTTLVQPRFSHHPGTTSSASPLLSVQVLEGPSALPGTTAHGSVNSRSPWWMPGSVKQCP